MEKAGLDSDAAYVSCDLLKPGWTEELISIGFDTKTKSFGSLPGTCYQTVDESTVTKKNEILAARAGEQMKAAYFPDELVLILQNCRFLINEQLNHEEMTEQYFEDHNAENPRHLMQAPEGVGYNPAVKSAE